jgi:transcriptional regulator with GAF, ATPase, and Fis domain
MIRLYVVQGSDKGRTIESHSESVSLGRSPSNQLVLKDSHISGIHGRIFRTPEGKILYRDLRSTNGSVILRGENRISLGPANAWQETLQDGDQLLLGDVRTPVVISCEILPSEPSDEVEQTIVGMAETVPEETTDTKVLAVRRIQEAAALAQRVERDPRWLQELYRFARDLTQSLDLADVAETVSAAVFRLFPACTHVGVLLWDEGSQNFIPILTRERGKGAGESDIGLSRSILTRVLLEGAALLVVDAPSDISSSQSIIGSHIRSTMCVPLWRGETITGVLQADNREAAGAFREEDLETLTVLAGHASLAIENARLYQRVKIAEEQLHRENRFLKEREEKRSRFESIVGQSAPMQHLFAQMEKVMHTNVTVCIEGETGTGKELVARAIHYGGPRKEKLFVTQNCSAIPDNLLESELFGHKKGAFTGADADKKGLFEIADGGSIFLDEIGEMSVTLQAKLLRVLQEGEIRPVGATKSKNVDVRVISATNRNLEEEVRQGRFREDLYYRLKVFPIYIPPLRERKDDIPVLAQHFLDRFSRELNKPVQGFSQQAMDLLVSYRWPGNIRELENEVQRLVIQCDPGSFILPDLLSPRIRKVENLLDKVNPRRGTLKEMMEQVERWILQESLRDHGGNKSRAAQTLGITREGLHKKLAKFGMN